MGNDFPHPNTDDAAKISENIAPDASAADIVDKTRDSVAESTGMASVPEHSFAKEDYLYAFLQNITPRSPYHRDPERIHLPRHSNGKLSKDEERLFEDLDNDTYSPSREPEHPFVPLVMPQYSENPLPKKGFFG